MIRPVALLGVVGMLGACASSANSIQATYVSPIKYQTYDCDQLRAEYGRVLSRSQSVNKEQDDTATGDAVAMGVGLVVFWPALFFIDTDDQSEEVARLKGELDALETATIEKRCLGLQTKMTEDRIAARNAAKELQNEFTPNNKSNIENANY